jgi:hypothetical protein
MIQWIILISLIILLLLIAGAYYRSVRYISETFENPSSSPTFSLSKNDDNQYILSLNGHIFLSFTTYQEFEEYFKEKYPSSAIPSLSENSVFSPPSEKTRKESLELLRERGFTYLPSSTWSVPQYRPPVCIPSKEVKDPVFVYTPTSLTPLDEFFGVGSILPRFEYRETNNYKIEDLEKKMMNQSTTMHQYYPGYLTSPPQKIEDLI